MKILNIILCLMVVWSLRAQETPAPPQTQSIAIYGGTAHIGNGQVIESSLITFENGKLTMVADMSSIRFNKDAYGKAIDATGKHVYPGFIAPNTQLGLIEISAVRATRDNSEIGDMNPHVRSIIAYNTDSDVPPTVRANGVLLAQVKPNGGTIDGQSSIVELDGWNWEDAVYKMDEGIFVDYPSMYRWNWRTRSVNKNKDYGKQIQAIEDYFKEAIAYSKNDKLTAKNLKFEAMRGLFDGSKKLYVTVDRARSITEAVLLFQQFNVTPIIVGGSEAWAVAEFLKKNNVPVILSKTHDLPSYDDSNIDQPFKSPAMLQKAGVTWCLQMDDSPENLRNLAFQAGHAVGFGLDKEVAVAAITLNTAKILGIDKTVGSLEKGKDATLFISTGDALDIRSNHVEHAFIRGKEISMDDKQKRLYRKFKKKYEEEK
ncbi:MAG: amidohydrolase family protein [Bacteroidota bacterium]